MEKAKNEDTSASLFRFTRIFPCSWTSSQKRLPIRALRLKRIALAHKGSKELRTSMSWSPQVSMGKLVLVDALANQRGEGSSQRSNKSIIPSVFGI